MDSMNITEELGFQTYEDYLASELWKQIRKRVFETHGTTCCCCERKATQVHHHEYSRKNVSGETIDGLYPVCPDCHTSVHFDGDQKLSRRQYRERLLKLIDLKNSEGKQCDSCHAYKPLSHYVRGDVCKKCWRRRPRKGKKSCRRCRETRTLKNFGSSVFCKSCRKALNSYRTVTNGKRASLTMAHSRECQQLGKRGADELTECVQCGEFKTSGAFRSGARAVCRTCRRKPRASKKETKAAKAAFVQAQWDNLFK